MWGAARGGVRRTAGRRGDSAGANLALALTLHEIAADRRRPDAALLFYGAFQAGVDAPSCERFAEGFGLTRAAMARFWDWYVPPGSPERNDPRVSPLQASDTLVARLPPTFVNAAGLDPLLCDSLDLAARLRAAGVTHALHVHEGVHHGFMQMSLRLPEAGPLSRSRRLPRSPSPPRLTAPALGRGWLRSVRAGAALFAVRLGQQRDAELLPQLRHARLGQPGGAITVTALAGVAAADLFPRRGELRLIAREAHDCRPVLGGGVTSAL